MKVAVFADVHLKVTPEGKETLDAFVSFLKSLQSKQYDCIVVLGDLFDFWFEYRRVIFSGYFDVLRALAELKDQGVELHLVCGNHDFWAGRFLEEQLGMRVHQADLNLTFDEKRVHFVHGDGLNPKDLGYRFYKALARSRVVIGLFRLLHPDWAMGLAEFVSNSSRSVKNDRVPSESEEVKVIRSYAEGVLNRDEADVVMCGHTHFAEEVTFDTTHGPRTYINTGDWLERRHYWEWDGARFRLQSADPEASTTAKNQAE